MLHLRIVTCSLIFAFVSSSVLHAQHEDEHEHGHADDAVIGFMICVDAAQRLAVEFDGDEVFDLPSVDGVLLGWAGDEPGFNTLVEDEPDEGFFAVAAGANVVLEIVSIEPGFKAHTPGFADILEVPGDTWDIGGAPFDTHPEWHIDPAAEGFDDAQETWSVTVRFLDTGTTSYLPSEPFTIQFARGAVGPFLRGDCNDDGGVDLADGVRMLNLQFLGGETPPCTAACDFNGSGQLDVSTAVFLFNLLFQGGPVPPAPYPTAAESNAPADIALGCR